MGTGRLCSVYLCMPSTRSGEPPEIRVPATASPWVEALAPQPTPEGKQSCCKRACG